MIKDEFKFITKNKLILLSVLVITLIPFLYSIFFLKSVWDPYGETGQLPVAVVNKDKAVDYEGQTLNVGKQTIAKLKKNHNLGWRFVSASKAKQGLKDNRYYTVITIPENFSAHAATVLDQHPQKMQLKYETNDSLNYIGQVISGIGVDKLDKEIRANVTNAYASAVFDQIKTVGKGMNTAAKGATQISDGEVTLDDGINQYTVGVSKVNDGLQEMKVSVSPMSSQIPRLASGANQVSTGATTIADKSGQLTSGAVQVANGLNTLNSKTGALASGTNQLTNGTQSLANGSQTFATKLKDYTNGVTQVSKGASTLQGTLAKQDLNGSADKLANGASQLSAGLQQMQAQVTASQKEAATQLPQLQAALSGYGAALKASNVDPALIAQYGQIVEKLTSVMNGVTTNSSDLSAGLAKMVPGAQQLAVGGQELKEKVPQLTNAITGLAAGSKSIVANNDALNAGAQQLSQGAAQLNQGASTMQQQVPALTGAIGQLSNGASQVANGNQQLATGVDTLAGGAQQVASGVNTLNASVPTLVSGVDQLSDGSQQLANNSDTLKNGSGQLKSGSKELATQLTSGAKQVNGITLTKDTAKMFAAPTKTSLSHYSYVPNYGHALAPYVLSVALYVGAIVFNFAYPIRKVSKKDGTATQWFFSKVTIGTLVATGAALVETTLMMVGGLTVAHVGQFYLFAILFSLASMYLIMFLSMLLDNPGRFLAMVGLMIQLGGAGGTFPMEITNHFYNVIHPFLPMTYSILGFRNALTGGIAASSLSQSIIVLVLFSLVSLVLLWLSMIWLQKRHLMGVSQLDGNQELQAVEK